MKEILKKVFESINSASIQYVILRNYDMLPDEIIGGDIDLLVSRYDTQRLKSILREKGFLIVPDIFPHHFALFFDKTRGKLIKFDIVDSLVFGQKMSIPFPGRYEKLMLARKVFHKEIYIPSAEDEIIFLLLHCVGDKGFIKQSYKEKLQKLTCQELDMRYLDEFFSKVFRQEICENTLTLIRDGKYEHLLRLHGKLRNFLLRKLNLKSFLVSLKILNKRFMRKLLRRKGLRIALMGPDGSGKTTLARKIRDRKIFNTMYVYMGRDQFFIPTRQVLQYLWSKLKKNEVADSNSLFLLEQQGILRVKGKCRDIIDVFRFFHDLIDYYVRYFLYNYLYCRKGSLVINDRYIYDMLSGEERVQNLPFIRWIIISLFPAPDFVFLLDAPIEKIYARKKEHSLETLQTMQMNFVNLSTIVKNCYFIRTHANPEESANEIISHIWKKYFCNLARR